MYKQTGIAGKTFLRLPTDLAGAVVLDSLSTSDHQPTHLLLGRPLASTMGWAASPRADS